MNNAMDSASMILVGMFITGMGSGMDGYRKHSLLMIPLEIKPTVPWLDMMSLLCLCSMIIDHFSSVFSYILKIVKLIS